MLDADISVHFSGSLLQLRGDEPTDPIHRDPKGNNLIFNGEIYDGLNISSSKNDGSALFSLLSATVSETGP